MWNYCFMCRRQTWLYSGWGRVDDGVKTKLDVKWINAYSDSNVATNIWPWNQLIQARDSVRVTDICANIRWWILNITVISLYSFKVIQTFELYNAIRIVITHDISMHHGITRSWNLLSYGDVRKYLDGNRYVCLRVKFTYFPTGRSEGCFGRNI